MNQPDSTGKIKTAYQFAVIGALIVIFAYFVPWVGVDSQSSFEKQATFTKSAYQLRKITDDEITQEVINGTKDKNAINSISDAYRLKNKEISSSCYKEIYKTETIRKLVQPILNMEESMSKLIIKVLEDDKEEQRLIQACIQAEKDSVEDTARKFRYYLDFLDGIGMEKIKDYQFSDIDLCEKLAEHLDKTIVPTIADKITEDLSALIKNPSGEKEFSIVERDVSELSVLLEGIPQAQGFVAVMEEARKDESKRKDLAAKAVELLPVLKTRKETAHHLADFKKAVELAEAQLNVLGMTNLQEILAKRSRMSTELIDKYIYLYSDENKDKLSAEEQKTKLNLLELYKKPMSAEYAGIVNSEKERLTKIFDAVFALGEKAVFDNKITKFDSLQNFTKLLSETEAGELQAAIDDIKAAADVLETLCVYAMRENKVSDEDVKAILAGNIAPYISNLDLRDEASVELAAQFLNILKTAPQDTRLSVKFLTETVPSRLDDKGKSFLKEVKDPVLLCRELFPSLSSFCIADEKISHEELNKIVTAGMEGNEARVKTAMRIADTILLFNEKEVSNIASFYLALNNDIYVNELLKNIKTENIKSGIRTYFSGYALVNKLGEKDFIGDKVRDDVKLPLYDKFFTSSFSGDAANFINTSFFMPVVSQENIVNGKITAGAQKAMLWNLYQENKSDKLLGSYMDPDGNYYALYSLVRENAQADKLRKTTIMRDTFRNELSGMIVDVFLAGMKEGMASKLAEENNLPKVIDDLKTSLCLDETSGACKIMKLYYETKDISNLTSAMIDDMQNSEGTNLSDALSYIFINHVFDTKNQEDSNDICRALSGALADQNFMGVVQNEIDGIDRTNVITAGYSKLFKEYSDLITSSVTAELITESTLDSLSAGISNANSTSKKRSISKAISYIKDMLKESEKNKGMTVLSENLNLGDPRKRGDIERKIRAFINAKTNANYALAVDTASTDSAMDIIKAFYGNAHIIKHSTTTIKNCSTAYEWASFLMLSAVFLAVLGIIGFAAGRNQLILSLVGSVALALLFWLAIRVSGADPGVKAKVLLVTGAGPIITGVGLFLIALGNLLTIQRLTNKQITVVIGAIMVLLGFFLPWVGKNPDINYAWRSGWNFFSDYLQGAHQLHDVWGMNSAAFVIFPAIAVLCAVISFLVKNNTFILFLTSALAICFYVGLVYGISQTANFWAIGIAVVTTGFATIMVGNSIKS